MKSIRPKLSTQLFIALLCLSFVPIIIVGVISYDTGKNIIIANAQTHLKTVAILKRQAIEKWTENLKNSLLWMSQEPLIRRETSDLIINGQSEQEKQAAYSSLVARFKRSVAFGDIVQVSLIDKNSGQIIASSAPSWVGKFRDTAPFFEQGKKELFVSDIFFSLSMGRPTMVASGPIKNEDGELLAVLVVHANFEELSDIMVERTGLSQTTETFLVNKSNLLITNTVFAPAGAFKKWIFGEGAKWAIEGKSDVDVFIDYRGKEVIGAYFWLPERKLALIAKQDVEEAFAPIAVLGQKIVMIALGIGIMAVLAGALFGNKIIKPIRRLVVATQAIGAGELDHRICSGAKDEIGTLSNAFDDMAESLKNKTISLSEKEVLLREIHHRVKNNLQMVQSLLSLQIGKFVDDDVVDALKDSMHRITSIAMVHETLYKADDLSTIDLDSYFQDLVKYLMKSLRQSSTDVDTVCSIEQIPMNLDGVISCGLIINELATNALKYAFTGRAKGTIHIRLQQTDERSAELVVADDGIGVDDTTTLMDRNTLGVNLVQILANNQLEGDVTVENDGGLKYRVTFPVSS